MAAAGTEVVPSQETYNQILPQAMAIPEAEVLDFRTDASLAYHNVKEGAEAVLPHKDAVSAASPLTNWDEIRDAPKVGEALMFADVLVNQTSGSPGISPERISRAYELRRILMAAAEALAEAGLLPSDRVKRIRAGRGKIDAATDCVGLVALLREYWEEIKTKTAVTEADLREAELVGTELLQQLKPARARRDQKVTDAEAQALEARDRIWTLLVRRHEQIWKIGALIWGRDVDDHVPSLFSTRRRAKTSR